VLRWRHKVQRDKQCTPGCEELVYLLTASQSLAHRLAAAARERVCRTPGVLLALHLSADHWSSTAVAAKVR
jgi:hypothetical protein